MVLPSQVVETSPRDGAGAGQLRHNAGAFHVGWRRKAAATAPFNNLSGVMYNIELQRIETPGREAGGRPAHKGKMES